MIAAVGERSPRPSPAWSSVVRLAARAWKSSQERVSPAGTSTPAASKASVLANTTYDCISVGAAITAPSGVVTVAHTSSDTADTVSSLSNPERSAR